MTKHGFKTKFIQTFCVLTVIIGLVAIFTSQNFAPGALVGQLVFSGIYMFLPAVVVAIIWEFFAEDKD